MTHLDLRTHCYRVEMPGRESVTVAHFSNPEAAARHLILINKSRADKRGVIHDPGGRTIDYHDALRLCEAADRRGQLAI